MTKKIIKDKQNRQKFKKYELKHLALKILANNTKIDTKSRHTFNLQLAKLPRNCSITRIHNRCIFTGRAHGIYKKLKISRILAREFISSGLLPGFTKSSW